MKLVTLAVAAERLGWDFTFETTIVTTGTLDSDGVLHGDLILRGSGDPSLGVGDTHAEQTLDGWAQTLVDEGIRRVDGRLICDDQSIAGTGLGAGWSWDYLSAGYAAPVAGLQVNENAAQVTMTPGQAAGQAAGVVLSPPESGLTIVGTVTTAAAGSPVSDQSRTRPRRDRGSREWIHPAGTGCRALRRRGSSRALCSSDVRVSACAARHRSSATVSCRYTTWRRRLRWMRPRRFACGTSHRRCASSLSR